MLSSDTPEFFIQGLGVPPGELVHAANTEEIEITPHGGSDGNQIVQLAGVRFHTTSLTNLYLTTSLI